MTNKQLERLADMVAAEAGGPPNALRDSAYDHGVYDGLILAEQLLRGTVASTARPELSPAFEYVINWRWLGRRLRNVACLHDWKTSRVGDVSCRKCATWRWAPLAPRLRKDALASPTARRWLAQRAA